MPIDVTVVCMGCRKNLGVISHIFDRKGDLQVEVSVCKECYDYAYKSAIVHTAKRFSHQPFKR